MIKRFDTLILLILAAIIAPIQLLPFLQQAFAQSDTDLTVETDDKLYKYTPDDISLIVFGRVLASLIEPNQQVNLQIYNPDGTAYPIQSASLGEDGWYSSEIQIAGKLGIEGEYRVVATYQGRSAETNFRVIDAIVESECARPCEYNLVVGNATYPITYLAGDKIRNMTINEGAKSLVIIPDPGSGGLTVVLPRSVVDSRDGSMDKNYTVLINGEAAAFVKTITDKQNEFTEIDMEDYRSILEQGQNPEDVRVLQIAYPRGLHQIDIVGTQIVPEFGLSSIALLFAIAIAFILSGCATLLHGTNRSL